MFRGDLRFRNPGSAAGQLVKISGHVHLIVVVAFLSDPRPSPAMSTFQLALSKRATLTRDFGVAPAY